MYNQACHTVSPSLEFLEVVEYPPLDVSLNGNHSIFNLPVLERIAEKLSPAARYKFGKATGFSDVQYEFNRIGTKANLRKFLSTGQAILENHEKIVKLVATPEGSHDREYFEWYEHCRSSAEPVECFKKEVSSNPTDLLGQLLADHYIQSQRLLNYTSLGGLSRTLAVIDLVEFPLSEEYGSAVDSFKAQLDTMIQIETTLQGIDSKDPIGNAMLMRSMKFKFLWDIPSIAILDTLQTKGEELARNFVSGLCTNLRYLFTFSTTMSCPATFNVFIDYALVYRRGGDLSQVPIEEDEFLTEIISLFGELYDYQVNPDTNERELYLAISEQQYAIRHSWANLLEQDYQKRNRTSDSLDVENTL
ncbi:hypothetical protein IWQ62_000670 [Dispira parvispora]|uniref:Uncharacterized protein n=1 Tax=Dispira parvispora TaxID=1520584 RepID=A0A9W8E9E3_9FUNG|nr:hypothetical protein IWQ62_000670 [Dispira parvispora]